MEIDRDMICKVEKCSNTTKYSSRGGYASFCSQHQNNHYECQESGCNKFSADRYCSKHYSSCDHCKKRVRTGRFYCDECSGGRCKLNFCQRDIYKGESGDYCSSHKENCHYGSHHCDKRISNYGEYCEDHKKECEFYKCDRRINNYSNHCSIHPREKQIEEYKKEWKDEENRAKELQTQLTKKDEAIDYLKEKLKELYVDEEQFEAWVQENYLPRFR